MAGDGILRIRTILRMAFPALLFWIVGIVRIERAPCGGGEAAGKGQGYRRAGPWSGASRPRPCRRPLASRAFLPARPSSRVRLPPSPLPAIWHTGHARGQFSEWFAVSEKKQGFSLQQPFLLLDSPSRLATNLHLSHLPGGLRVLRESEGLLARTGPCRTRNALPRPASDPDLHVTTA